MNSQQRSFARGYFCAVAALIRMQGVHAIDAQARELFRGGGDPALADRDDQMLFAEAGLMPAVVIATRTGQPMRQAQVEERAELAHAEPPAESEELYQKARAFVLEQGSASVSRLQRHLRIAFNPACRLMRQLEARGVIAACTSGSPFEPYRLLPQPGA